MTLPIKNIEALTMDELENLVMQGGKFVVFQYVISIVVACSKSIFPLGQQRFY
jgi:hypothetical protein